MIAGSAERAAGVVRCRSRAGAPGRRTAPPCGERSWRWPSRARFSPGGIRRGWIPWRGQPGADPRRARRRMDWIRANTDPAACSWPARITPPRWPSSAGGACCARRRCSPLPDDERRVRAERAVLSGRRVDTFCGRYGVRYVLLAPGSSADHRLAEPWAIESAGLGRSSISTRAGCACTSCRRPPDNDAVKALDVGSGQQAARRVLRPGPLSHAGRLGGGRPRPRRASLSRRLLRPRDGHATPWSTSRTCWPSCASLAHRSPRRAGVRRRALLHGRAEPREPVPQAGFNEHTPRFWTDAADAPCRPRSGSSRRWAAQWGLASSDHSAPGLDLRCSAWSSCTSRSTGRCRSAEQQRRARRKRLDVCEQVALPPDGVQAADDGGRPRRARRATTCRPSWRTGAAPPARFTLRALLRGWLAARGFGR